jgi:hypothetical protein
MSLGWIQKALMTIFGNRYGRLNKSKLVGMYLEQTNRRELYSAELQANRQRRNGRYSHNRERA